MALEMTLAVAVCLALGQVENSASSTTDAVIERSINELAADKYDVRQAAMERLWAAGEAAISALEQASKSKVAEVRYRAQFVLENLEMGIGADSPKSILREVDRFRSEGLEERRRAMQFLETAARPRVILALLKTEPDERMREEWYQNLERATMDAIELGKFDEVSETLHRAKDREAWTRHWAAYSAQRGATASELARLDKTLPASPASTIEAARMRAYLYRANGDLSEACRHAEHVSDEFFISLLAERRDWPQVARRTMARFPPDLHQVGDDFAAIALAAAYCGLAGDMEQKNRCLEALKVQAEEITDQIQKLNANQHQQRTELVERKWQIAKAIFLNGRFDEALTMIKTDRPLFVFEILCEQHRYREAFELVGEPYPNGFDAKWFRRLAQDSTDDLNVMEHNYPIGQLAIRHLQFLGRGDEAQEYFQILLDAAKTDRATGRLRRLCDTAVRLSAREKALEIAELIVEKEDRPNVLAILHPAQFSTAMMWWEHFRDKFPQDKLNQTLNRVEVILAPRRFQEQGGNIEQSIAEAAAGVPRLLEARRPEWWHELAETCVLHNRRDLAVSYYELAAASNFADALKLGDSFAVDNQWQRAANWYSKAWEFDKVRALPLYLHARALMQCGREAEGRELADRALLMPMASSDLRHELASGLKERGYRAEARQQFELLLCTGYPLTDKMIDAAKQIGNLTYTQEELHAAECWETMLLCCMKPTWRFIETGGYVQIPFLVHKTRARGLVKAGRFDDGVREAWDSFRVSPGNLELPEEVVPLLDAANRKSDADQLFARSAGGLAELCRDFPSCATFHNNLAWLSARCDRQLDVALTHAQRAVALEANKAGFLDTLAEVHFRRGEFDQAIACAERCVKMEPRNPNYQQQLDRFRAGKR